MSVKNNQQSEDVSIISGGVKIEGTLTSDGNVRIDGAVKGNVVVNGNLTVGESARLQGEVKANNVTFGGNLEGKITATDTLRLEAKSVLKGDIVTRKLIVEEGAMFDGHSSMNKTAPTLTPERPQKISNERKEQ